MSKLVRIEERLSDGLMLLTVLHFGEVFGSQLWSRCKARKRGRCDASGTSYAAGSSVYRPVGNQRNRMMRILATSLEEAPAGARPA